MAKKLCPVCGVPSRETGQTTDGRVILSCGDAVWVAVDARGRRSWRLRREVALAKVPTVRLLTVTDVERFLRNDLNFRNN